MLSAELALVVQPHVPASPGMVLGDALELIFSAQQNLFSPPHRRVEGADQPHQSNRPAMSRDEAQLLTSRIKSGLGEVPLLLLEAHERRAWVPLRHHSWERYVRTEFGLSRSRSYEILDQARVKRTLGTLVGEGHLPPISALAAVQIKPYLNEVVAEIRRQLEGGSPEVGIEGVVVENIRRARLRARAAAAERSRSNGRRSSAAAVWPRLVRAPDGSADMVDDGARGALRSLAEAVHLLADQPPAAQFIWSLSEQEIGQLTLLPAAACWVSAAAAAWSARCANRTSSTVLPRFQASPRKRSAV